MFHKTHPHLLKEDSAEHYNNKKIPIESIQTQWIRNLIRKLEFLVVNEVSHTVFPEQSEIMFHPIGSSIPSHVDVYDTMEGETIVPKSEWAAVVYLNQDYKGGTLRFDPCEELPMGFEYQPIAREMVIFQGMEFKHSVSKVYRNNRYTLPMWFTTDFNDIRPEYPTI